MQSLKIDGVEVKCFAEIDSTNNEAKRQALAGYSAPMLFVADSQTAGRGRMGRSFYSPNSTGLYMSYLYKPQGSIADAVTVTAAASVAVVRAIEELSDLKPLIKWVNDIYLDGKKVAGILTESVTDRQGVASVIVGIGINIDTDFFPEDIKSVAGSLGVGLSRDTLAKTVVTHLKSLVEGLSERLFLEDYINHSLVLGREVVYIIQGVEYTAKAVGIDENAGLVVEDNNGNRTTLSTGEISVRV